MASPVEIAIPRTAVAPDPKPYTIYEISLRLPLQSFVLKKRYSDFVKFHDTLISQTGTAPPASLPPKHYFARTTHNETLTESRRTGLEIYLQAINSGVESKWREAPIWRAFLNLPSNLLSKSSKTSVLGSRGDGSIDGGASDPAVWLNFHRELKTVLHEARLNVTARDSAEDIGTSHEKAAEAKKALVRAGTMITSLERGLKAGQQEWGSDKLGDGEVRRRRDLIGAGKKEKEDLEKLLASIAKKKEIDQLVEDKRMLVDGYGDTGHNGTTNERGVKKGRILGKETSKTRELDNKGVLQLQQQMMYDQDEDVETLAATVRRQKDLAIQINEELEFQIDAINIVNEDATRLDDKIGVAKKRIGKIH
ncbi:hypothetical protein MMC10_000057 [Thelotrema lepadinum]|nr:hypothetical protein [Thelotrema lepadinum]